MAAQPLDELGAADDDPGLRAAEQLVAREADEVGAGRERSRADGSSLERREHARAEVVDERQPCAARPRASSSTAAAP
jgi:hypothetical protein